MITLSVFYGLITNIIFDVYLRDNTIYNEELSRYYLLISFVVNFRQI